MGQEYLIDSNTVIDYLDGKLPFQGMAFMNKIVDENIFISVITKIEVLGYNMSFKVQKMVEDFIVEATVHNLNDAIVNRTILIRKKYRNKLPDAIIAATALTYDCTLITNNEKDFNNIPDLKILNPYKM